MLIIKISDGRTYLFQWDRGVKFNLLCGSDVVTEMHFVTPNGTIRREVEGNTVNVPDAALQTAGTLTMYAFLRDASCAITRREVHMQVLARPKPADYIDPAGEEDYIDVIVDRLKKLPEVKGEKGDPGEPGANGAPGKDGSDATVTAQNIEAALGYAPVKDVQVAGTSILADGVANVPIASSSIFGVVKANSWEGTVMRDGILSVFPSFDSHVDNRNSSTVITPTNLDYAVKAAMCDGKGAAWTSAEQAAARSRMGIDKPYELIETVVVTEDISRFERTAEPNGTPYSFTAMRIHFGADFNGVSDVKSGIYALIYLGDTSHPEYIYQYLPISPYNASLVMVNSVAWAELTHGYWLSLTKQNNEGGPTGNGSWTSNILITNPSARLVLSGATLPRISKVTVIPYTGDKVIQSGVTINIYGVRA